MRTHVRNRFQGALVCGALVAAGTLAHVNAQLEAGPEKYNATAVALGSGQGVAGRVLVSIDRWTTPQQRADLLGEFQQKGPDKLLDALQRSPSVGYIRLPNTLAWDLRYAFQSPLPDNGRRVLLATDRPIGVAESRDQPRRLDYPFTLLEIRFNKDGVGEGKMSVYTKITLSKDKQTLELENYGMEPVRLTDVRIEK